MIPRPVTTDVQTESLLAPAIVLQAMADPLRLRVIELLLTQELCVCDLCDRLQVKQPKLSFHLRQLREAGLIQARPQGRWTYYSLCPHRFAALQVWLQRFSQAQPAIASTCQE